MLYFVLLFLFLILFLFLLFLFKPDQVAGSATTTIQSCCIKIVASISWMQPMHSWFIFAFTRPQVSIFFLCMCAFCVPRARDPAVDVVVGDFVLWNGLQEVSVCHALG